jgi:hypothetical protein
MTERGDERFTARATWPVVRKRQENVRGVLAFLREVSASTRPEISESVMTPFGSHEEALGACWRCVSDLSPEDEGDGEAGPSPFMSRVNELVSALAAAHRSVLREKEVMMQLLGCVYDVPHFGSREYEGLLDPGGHREVFVKNATFMAAVKRSLNSVRGYLERSETPVDMDGMMWYYTHLMEQLDEIAKEALEVFCQPFMELSELPDALKEKIAGFVGHIADTPNTTTVIPRPTVTGGPVVREDFLGTDNF